MKISLLKFNKSLIFCLFFVFITTLYAEEKLKTIDNVQNMHANLIKKSPNDLREYNYFELENGLKVTLVHDAEISNTTASMTVQVGAFSDPKNRQGLAHFLEHMLFLGSKKYPEPDEYSDYITKKGGSSNAFTSSERTTYYFTINNDVFEGALDRFAQFFIYPLFTEKFVEREINAVHAEYSKNINNDGRRIYQVNKVLANKQHPYHNFSTGNKETLSGDNIRKELIEFYLQHYTANKMTLSIVSKKSIDELQKLVHTYFSEIKNVKSKKEKVNHHIYDKKLIPAFLKIKPLKNYKSLSLSFSMPSFHQYYGEQSFHLISKIIGTEEKGSLLSFLKKNNWASSLSAGGSNLHDSFAQFSINISLTEQGEKHINQIIEQTFAFIHLVKENGIKKWRFNENKKLSEIAFVYKEKQNAANLARSLSQNMQDFPVEDLLYYPYKYTNFNPQRINQILSYLTPKNMVMTHVSQNVSTDQIEKYYGAQYSKSKVDRKLIQKWSEILNKGNENKALTLPKQNQFIPQSIDIINLNQNASAQLPQKIFSNKKIDFWFLHDDQFNLPKSSLRYQFLIPRAYQSPKEAAMSKLLVRIWNESLNEALYPAYEAGFGVSFSASDTGFNGSMSGYADKFPLLLDLVLSTFKTVQVNPSRFETMKKDLLKSWKNRKLNSASSLASYDFFILNNLNIWYQDDYINIIPKITLQEVKQFAERVFNQMKITAFLHGNTTAKKAKKLFDTFDTFKNFQPLFDSQIPEGRYLFFDNQKETVRQIQAQEDNAAIFLAYQYFQKRSIKDILSCQILSQLIQKPFFHQLRTIEQLGYIVQSTMLNHNFVCHMAFIIQSPLKNPIELQERIEIFIQDYAHKIEQITENEIDTLKHVINSRYHQPVQTTGQIAGRYWGAILNKDNQFLIYQPYIETLKEITKKDIIELYQNLFLKADPRKLAVQVFGKKMKFIEDSKNIKNINQFKKSSIYFGHQYLYQIIDEK